MDDSLLEEGELANSEDEMVFSSETRTRSTVASSAVPPLTIVLPCDIKDPPITNEHQSSMFANQQFPRNYTATSHDAKHCRQTMIKFGSSSSDSDDDDENYLVDVKKNKRAQRPRPQTDDYEPFVNPLSSSNSVATTELSGKPSAEFWKPPGVRKANNIWGSQLQEQALTDTINKVDVKYSAKQLFTRRADRGCESYDITAAKLAKRSIDATEVDKLAGGGDGGEELVQKESFGMGPTKESARDVDYSDGDDNDENNCENGDEDEYSAFLGSGDGISKRRDDGRRNYDTAIDRSLSDIIDITWQKNNRKRAYKFDQTLRVIGSDVCVTCDSPEESVTDELLRVLVEPPNKRALFERIVQILGRKWALDLLEQTQVIENSGGLMINNGARRRTPGGVYLQLLRQDESLKPENLQAIFVENEIWKSQQKALKKTRYRQKLAAKKLAVKEAADKTISANDIVENSTKSEIVTTREQSDGEIIESSLGESKDILDLDLGRIQNLVGGASGIKDDVNDDDISDLDEDTIACIEVDIAD